MPCISHFSFCHALSPPHPQKCSLPSKFYGKVLANSLLPLFFVYNKIKTTHVKQVIIGYVISEIPVIWQTSLCITYLLCESQIFSRAWVRFSRNAFSVAVENGCIPSARELICFSVILSGHWSLYTAPAHTNHHQLVPHVVFPVLSVVRSTSFSFALDVATFMSSLLFLSQLYVPELVLSEIAVENSTTSFSSP